MRESGSDAPQQAAPSELQNRSREDEALITAFCCKEQPWRKPNNPEAITLSSRVFRLCSAEVFNHLWCHAVQRYRLSVDAAHECVFYAKCYELARDPNVRNPMAVLTNALKQWGSDPGIMVILNDAMRAEANRWAREARATIAAAVAARLERNAR